MVLVDTSVWIDHFRVGNARLQALLEGGEVLIHPFILGELACGNFRDRRRTLDMLEKLQHVVTATEEETRAFIERRSLYGRGIGYIDLHLLASAVLSDHCVLWTADKRLRGIAGELSVEYGAG